MQKNDQKSCCAHSRPEGDVWHLHSQWVLPNKKIMVNAQWKTDLSVWRSVNKLSRVCSTSKDPQSPNVAILSPWLLGRKHDSHAQNKTIVSQFSKELHIVSLNRDGRSTAHTTRLSALLEHCTELHNFLSCVACLHVCYTRLIDNMGSHITRSFTWTPPKSLSFLQTKLCQENTYLAC